MLQGYVITGNTYNYKTHMVNYLANFAIYFLEIILSITIHIVKYFNSL
jgi:hypothetical protein